MERVLSISPQRITSYRDDLETIRYTPDRLVASLFRCWHRRLSWPITRDRQTYRSCLKCGMRRSFDPKAWRTFGPFYSPD